jgi:hypothetical protein
VLVSSLIKKPIELFLTFVVAAGGCHCMLQCPEAGLNMCFESSCQAHARQCQCQQKKEISLQRH